MTITLPQELERILEEKARQQGTTPDLLAIDSLTKLYLPPVSKTPDEPDSEGRTMADFLKDYVGCIDSSAVYPEGSRLSENTGRKFAALMVEKRKKGQL